MAVVEAFDIYRFFHTRESETLALRGVSLRLDEGELVAVLGGPVAGQVDACLPACRVWMNPMGGMPNYSGSA